MRRTSLVTTIVFVAGLGIGFFARSAVTGTLERRTHAADLAAIEKLHQKDIEVTLPQDPKGLLDIFTEDAVRFNPGSLPAVGKQAIQAENDKFRADYPGFKVLSYAPEYKNTQIENGWACEWGEHQAQFKLSPETPPVSLRLKGFDVLRRQSDGSWRFAVLILDQ
jgi:ketosteroid isomerase-like protein